MADLRQKKFALDQTERLLATKAATQTDYESAVAAYAVSQANLKSSTPEIIDMGDFAMIAQQWMTEQLWPTP